VEETLAGLPDDLFGIYGRFLIRAKESLKKNSFYPNNFPVACVLHQRTYVR
jgi:hypothetical protein